MNADKEYERKYKVLKRKLKYLIYENEAFAQEIQSLERKVVQVQRDKNFLLERLLHYEAAIGTDGHSSDPEETESSDGETRAEISRRKKLKSLAQQPSTPPQAKKKKMEKKPVGADKTDGLVTQPLSSRESSFNVSARYKSPLSAEIENRRMLNFNPGQAPPTVPVEMFNTDSSHNDSELGSMEQV